MSLKECSAKRPYCFSLPERSHINAREAYDPEGWCDTCDHFMDCQYAACTNPPRILTLTMKYKYFDEIKNGIKTEEYREVKDYWISRLEGKHFDVIELTRGRFVEKGDIDRRLWFRYEGYRIELMDWCERDLIFRGPTIVIPLNGRLQYPYQAIEEQRRDTPASA